MQTRDFGFIIRIVSRFSPSSFSQLIYKIFVFLFVSFQEHCRRIKNLHEQLSIMKSFWSENSFCICCSSQRCECFRDESVFTAQSKSLKFLARLNNFASLATFLINFNARDALNVLPVLLPRIFLPRRQS